MNAVIGITLLIASLFIVKTHEMTIQSFYGSLLDPPIDQNSGNDDVWDVPPVTSSGDKDTEDTSVDHNESGSGGSAEKEHTSGDGNLRSH